VTSPLALEAVRRIDELFEIERAISGQNSKRRRTVQQELSALLAVNMAAWMREQLAELSRSKDVAKAVD
jgi:transposase